MLISLGQRAEDIQGHRHKEDDLGPHRDTVTGRTAQRQTGMQRCTGKDMNSLSIYTPHSHFLAQGSFHHRKGYDLGKSILQKSQFASSSIKTNPCVWRSPDMTSRGHKTQATGPYRHRQGSHMMQGQGEGTGLADTPSSRIAPFQPVGTRFSGG